VSILRGIPGKYRITAWGGPHDGAVIAEGVSHTLRLHTEPWPGFTGDLAELTRLTGFSRADGDEAARALHDGGVAEIFPLLHKLDRVGISTACAVRTLCLALAATDGP
jgi:hypothetical protein